MKSIFTSANGKILTVRCPSEKLLRRHNRLSSAGVVLKSIISLRLIGVPAKEGVKVRSCQSDLCTFGCMKRNSLLILELRELMDVQQFVEMIVNREDGDIPYTVSCPTNRLNIHQAKQATFSFPYNLF